MFERLVKIFRRVINSIRLFKLRFSYDYAQILNEQNKLYLTLGFDREEAVSLLEDIYTEHPNIKVMLSEHHTLFGAVSLKHNIKKVLEIGTYKGSCTKLLSILFPDAQITTIDLPDDDPIFSQTYERGESNERARFINERDQLIQTCKNVTFVQQNSLHLVHKRDQKYDLAWVDGAHGYPTVAMDIVNSLACLSKEGFMFIDDVWIDRSANDPNYRSIGAYESILALKHAGLIGFDLVPKRIEFPHGKGHMKKFIALVHHSESRS